MRNILLAGVSALAFLLGTPTANAQHGPSSYFDGHTRLYNPGGLGGPAISKSFTCSFWYNTENENSTVLFDTSGYIKVALLVALTHELGTDNIFLSIAVGNFAGDHAWTMISRNPLPIDGQWHHVAFTMTTSLHLALASIDGNQTLFDDNQFATTDTGPFDIPVNGNRWMVGAALGPSPILPPLFLDGQFVGTAVAPYTGGLDQLTCKFADDSYIDILRPNRGQGFVESAYTLDGTRIIFRPRELGSYCSMPWGGGTAELCMRGPPEWFKLNNGGSTAFTTIEGGLVDFVDSPFSKWWE
jgi:hypothetical protein